jgi:hypothetical protein
MWHYIAGIATGFVIVIVGIVAIGYRRYPFSN